MQAEVVERLCRSVGWRLDNHSYSIDTLTVKTATALIVKINPLHPDQSLPQSAKLQAFAGETGLVLTEDDILKVLHRLWRVPVDNAHRK